MIDLVIRDVDLGGGANADVGIRDGRICHVGKPCPEKGRVEIDGARAALLPGLVDHHLHLLAWAAEQGSVALASSPDWATALAEADRRLPKDAWIRATGYHESAMGALDRDALDAVLPDRPARLQHSSGSLWVLNSAALTRVPAGMPLPRGAERDADGRPTGRLFREDGWLRAAFPADLPSLGEPGRILARFGITGITDASVTNDEAAARLLDSAGREQGFGQRVMLMTGQAEIGGAFDEVLRLGPVKVLLDDDALGDPGALAARIGEAHRHDRNIAIHCVTHAQLAFSIAAFDEVGARPGDRIEHGSLIDDAGAGEIARHGLIVVSQPAFIHSRGDRYRREVDRADQPDLYRLQGLLRRGIRLAGSSDAPYGPVDPWHAMRAAVSRRTEAGAAIGPDERLTPRRALDLYLGSFARPDVPRAVIPGATADLCLMAAPLDEVLQELDAGLVRESFVGGRGLSGAFD